jgi:hypothetical protein
MSINLVPPELTTLPMHSIKDLCSMSINVARQLDGFLRLCIREKGYGRVEFPVIAGELGILRVERSFRMINE